MAKKMISMKLKQSLLDAVDCFCNENDMTRTEYFERLAEHHLKKRGRILEKRRIVKDWDSVDDMPSEPQTITEKWIRVA